LNRLPKPRHSREGWSRGFVSHATRLRNDAPVQRRVRPARWNPVHPTTELTYDGLGPSRRWDDDSYVLSTSQWLSKR
jgi:hypothetical protein